MNFMSLNIKGLAQKAKKIGLRSYVISTSPYVGYLGGILCVWDPRVFIKSNLTGSDYFVIIRGEWIPNGKQLLIITIYAPQELSEKKMLWDYLTAVIGLMSSCTNIHAITLDRYLSDHRPILIREAHFDYGPIPFRFYHYWFEMEGFDTFVERTWNEAQCGTDKSPGPDGFTFGFYRRYWSFLEKDVEQVVRYFFHHGTFSKAGKSYFIALIPKTHNANKFPQRFLLVSSKWKDEDFTMEGRLKLLKFGFSSNSPSIHVIFKRSPTKVLQKMESIRCHFFNCVDQNGKKPIWVKWNKVLDSKEKGGLGVSSLYALNRALLFK
ncbi:hypothetical protein Tco_0565279 [Tanacetum coccineum]